MHFLGLNVMPRRIASFPDSFHSWNYLSSIGSGITFLYWYFLYVYLLILYCLCLSFFIFYYYVSFICIVMFFSYHLSIKPVFWASSPFLSASNHCTGELLQIEPEMYPSAHPCSKTPGLRVLASLKLDTDGNISQCLSMPVQRKHL